MRKIAVYSPVPDHTHDTEHIIIQCGINLPVAFSDTDKFAFTADAKKADIVCMGYEDPREYNDQGNPEPVTDDILTEVSDFCKPFARAKLFLDVSHMMHVGEGHSDLRRLSELADNAAYCFATAAGTECALIHTNLASCHEESQGFPPRLSKHMLYSDFLWNRHQVFYKYQPSTVFKSGHANAYGSHWYPYEFDTSVYELSDLEHTCSDEFIQNALFASNFTTHKLFVSPCMTRGSTILRRELSGYADPHQPQPPNDDAVRDYLRTQLIMLLRNYPGYIGDPATGNFLMGQGVSEERLHQQISVSGQLGWTPIHNTYYENSVLSIYTETITMNTRDNDWWYGLCRSITEKTWEPLIKGHFILPFGYQGMIADLVYFYDVALPDWIDYSYDDTENDLERWYLYNKEIKRVLALGAQTLYNNKSRDVHILQHNRKLFMEGGYRDTVTTALQDYCRDKPDLETLFAKLS